MRKKIITCLMIAALILTALPFSDSVSAATLNSEDITNNVNNISTNTYYHGLGQCYGFARNTFAKIYGINVKNVFWDYTNGTTESDYLYVVMTTKKKNELTTLLNLAQTGDVFSYGGGSGNPHSMIFVSNDEENQEIIVLDANWGSASNIIQQHTIPYEQLSEFISRGNILSLFRFTPKKLKLNSDSETLYLGADDASANVTLTYDNTSRTYTAPTWSSSDVSVATVDQNGKVTAISIGTTVITCEIGDKTAKCTVTVELTQLTVDMMKERSEPLIVPYPSLEQVITEKVSTLPVPINVSSSISLMQTALIRSMPLLLLIP